MATFPMSNSNYETIFRPRRGHLQYKSGFIFLIQYSGIQYLSHGIEIEALIQLCAALTWPPLTPGATATQLPYWSTRTFWDLPSDLIVVPTWGNSCGIGAFILNGFIHFFYSVAGTRVRGGKDSAPPRFEMKCCVRFKVTILGWRGKWS